MPITINIILDVPEYLFITIGVVAFAVFSRIIDRPFLGDHMQPAKEPSIEKTDEPATNSTVDDSTVSTAPHTQPAGKPSIEENDGSATGVGEPTTDDSTASSKPSAEGSNASEESRLNDVVKTTASTVPAIRPKLKCQSNSMFFSKLNYDVRRMIYDHLLRSTETISPERQLVGDKREELRFDSAGYKPAADLDSILLRLCKAVYLEAKPVLYRDNLFLFRNQWEMKSFAEDNFKTLHSKLKCASVEQRGSRFSHIHHIAIDMSRVEGFSIFSSLMQRWGHLLNKEVIRLPALKYLTIVFEGWALSHVAERRFLQCFIARLKTMIGLRGAVGPGLKKVTFIGQCDETTKARLDDLTRLDGKVVVAATRT